VEVMMERRDFLRSMCYGGIATFGFPVVSFAHVRQNGRLVFVLLRGGFDGLAAVVPYGDPAYSALRGALAFDSADLLPLDGPFGLAPGLAGLREFHERGELVVLHALAIPYRTRSHFDGQAVLETGLDRPIGASDGWLNRLLQVMPGERSGIAIASGIPRSMTGTHEVQTWSPTQLGVVDDEYLDRLAVLYRADGTLHGRFEAAMQQQDLVGEEVMAGGGARRGGVTPLLEAAARILRQETGAERGRRRVQRLGHAREPGCSQRSARPAPGTTGGRARRVPHGDAGCMGRHYRRRHDGVRQDRAAERDAGHRPWDCWRRLRNRPTGGAFGRARRLARSRRRRTVRRPRPDADPRHAGRAEGRDRRDVRPDRDSDEPRVSRLERRARSPRHDALTAPQHRLARQDLRPHERTVNFGRALCA
jgi:hypothetical protein